VTDERPTRHSVPDWRSRSRRHRVRPDRQWALLGR
jgi:hypothetical protein